MTKATTLATLTQQNVDIIAQLEAASKKTRTRGERISDMIARSIGGWTFILTQAAILSLWMALNVLAWTRHWDPYPFILLNLALSFQAAFTGPILMMSQNRQSHLIERRHQLDLQINLLAEQENTEILRLLRLLCKKAGIGQAEMAATELLSQETKADALIEQIDKSSSRPESSL